MNEGCTREESDIQDAKTVEACHDFLTSLSTKELLWLQEFQEFLIQDVDYIIDGATIFRATLYDFNVHGRGLSIGEKYITHVPTITNDKQMRGATMYSLHQ